MFENLVGNELVKKYLQQVLLKKSVGNSLLLAGPEGVGKSLFAKEFAKEFLCMDDPSDAFRAKVQKERCPDLHIYKPEGKTGMHSIEAMRNFTLEVYMPPMEGKRKVFVLLDAERMLPYSANALLKTFEEPALDTLIILVSGRPAALLPTILSRCRKLYFHALNHTEITSILVGQGVSADKARELAAVSQGSVSQALRLLEPDAAARRDTLLQALSRGRLDDYSQLSKLAQALAGQIESANEAWAETVRQELKKEFSDKPSAVQQQAIDKELDGAVAMRVRTEAQSIFDVVLSWYRDLELLSVNYDKEKLINVQYAPQLVQARQAGRVGSLDDTFKAIKDVQTLLDRSTSLTICLENLFLKLGLL